MENDKRLQGNAGIWSLISFKWLFSAIVLIMPINVSSQGLNINDLKGIWVGNLEIQGAASLRMGIVVNDDGKAALNIIDQLTGNIPVDEIGLRGDSVFFRLKGLGITIAGKTDNEMNRISSVFLQHDGSFPVVFLRSSELPKLNRPQEPKPPFPYMCEDVSCINEKAGIRLAGTLTIPKSDHKVPCAILITGSGQQRRDEDVAGHKPFLVIADYLSRNGIAVLRLDDRGTGGSTGNFDRATTGDFAGDIMAATGYLKKRGEIDGNRIGLIGHSEGASVGAIVASESQSAAFLITLSGPCSNFEDIVISQILDQLRLGNTPENDIELQKIWRKRIYGIISEPTDSATAGRNLWKAYYSLTEDEKKRIGWPEGRMKATIPVILNPWWRFEMALDIKSIYKNIQCPVLALYGSKDTQVNPGENSSEVDKSLKEGGNKEFTVRILPGLNHLFQTAGTGSEYEYAQIEETISPAVLTLIGSWINSR